MCQFDKAINANVYIYTNLVYMSERLQIYALYD